MKSLRLLLILSLLGNVWLAASVISRVRSQPEEPAAPHVFEPVESTPPSPPAPAVAPERTLRETAQDLRAAGLSPALMERILVQLIDESEPVDTRSFWQAAPRLSTRDQQQRVTENEQALLDALGDDYRFGTNRLASLRKLYGDYPPEQLDHLDTLLRDYMEMGAEAREQPADAQARRELSALLAAELETDLLELLGPEGFFDYQVRNSATAQALRNNVGAFSPTESEFREIFRLFAADKGSARNPLELRTELPQFLADPANQSALVSTLGEERTLELDLATDPKLAAENRFLNAFNLPSSTLVALQGLRARQESALAALPPLTTSTLSRENIDSALLAFAQINADLDTLLTPEIAARYRETHGEWLKLPEPAKTPPPPK